MAQKKIRVKLVGRDAGAAYIALPGHRHEAGIVKRAVRVDEFIPNFKGPMVLLDFDKSDTLIGIEILVFASDAMHGSRKDRGGRPGKRNRPPCEPGRPATPRKRLS
jgi:hypothetical protein